MRALLLASLTLCSSPALAQHMDMGHDMPMGQDAPTPAPTPAPAPSPAASAPAHGQHDQHGGMTMPEGGHDPHAHPTPATPANYEPVPSTPTPPPPAAGSGPARAADAIWGDEAMRASREELRREHGGQAAASLLADRLEYRLHEGKDGYAWEGEAWYGSDIDKLWLKSEGEGTFGGKAERAELQGLWSHAIGPWFDLQAGLRHDFAGPARSYAVAGVQGLAPYEFEVSAAAFLSDKGELTARAEGTLDQRVTQRLILQPRAEINLSAQDIPELGIGAGLDRAELGLRLRYELAREFAPYVGISQEWRAGRSATYAHEKGDAASTTSLVVGIRAWF